MVLFFSISLIKIHSDDVGGKNQLVFGQPNFSRIDVFYEQNCPFSRAESKSRITDSTGRIRSALPVLFFFFFFLLLFLFLQLGIQRKISIHVYDGLCLSIAWYLCKQKRLNAELLKTNFFIGGYAY